MSSHWAVLLIALVVVVKCDDECSVDVSEACPQEVDEAEIASMGGSFPKKEFLDKYCGLMLENGQCLRDFHERCPDVDMSVDPAIIESMIEVVTLLCDEDSEIRKGYLENVLCYDSAIPEAAICVITTFVLVEDFEEKVQNRTEFQHPSLGQCVGFPTIINCVIEEFSNECGIQETGPLAEILHRMIPVFLQISCPQDMISTWEQEFHSYLEEDKKRKKKK